MTESWAGVAALQELHIGGSRHLRSAQASQIHIIQLQLQVRHTICEQTSPVPCHAQIGALRPYSSCHVPRTPRMWRITGMNAEHNETVGQQVQT